MKPISASSVVVWGAYNSSCQFRSYVSSVGSAGNTFTADRLGDVNKAFADSVAQEKQQYRQQQSQNDEGGDNHQQQRQQQQQGGSRRQSGHRIVIPSLSGGAAQQQATQHAPVNHPYRGLRGKPLTFAHNRPKPVSEQVLDSSQYVQSPQPKAPERTGFNNRQSLPQVTYRRELNVDEEEDMPNSTVIAAIPGDDAAYLRRQQEVHRTRVTIDAQNEQLYWANKSHLRKTKRLEDEYGGLEEAIQETLTPSTTSFRSELKKRPLDRGILEEIHRNLHGRRAESRLKKNVHAEHWVMKNEGNLPVLEASKVAQQTFGFGGMVEKKASASSSEHFPISSNPEVAFVGRTNSGRSSLINAICNKHIARYGLLKGTTTSVDFYEVGGRLTLVDLPGYGFYNPSVVDPLKSKHSFGLVDSYLHTLGTSLRDRQELKREAREQAKEGTSSSSKARTTSGDDGDGATSATGDDVEGTSSQNTHNNSKKKTTRPYTANTGKMRNIRRVFVCVPAGTGMHRDDEFMCKRLEEMQIPFSVLLVKTDLVTIKMLARIADHTRSQLAQYSCCSELLMVNALRLAGIPKLQNLLGLIARRDALPEQLADLDFESIV